MEKNINIYGETLSLAGPQAVSRLESAIGEGWVGNPNGSGPNVFGRNVVNPVNSDLSYLVGLATTGLRVGAFLDGDSLVRYAPVLAEASRRHLPIVVSATPPTWQEYGESGCFQLFASSVQELVDLNLIAHRIAELGLIPGVVFF